jgi:flagellar protein FlaI
MAPVKLKYASRHIYAYLGANKHPIENQYGGIRTSPFSSFPKLKLGRKKGSKEQSAALETPILEEAPQASTFKEVYPLQEPYSYAAISRDPQTGGLRYLAIEPTLRETEKQLLATIKKILVEELKVDLKSVGNREKAEQYLRGQVQAIIDDYKIIIEPETLDKLMYYVARDYIHFGKIDPLMRDHMIEDISADGVGVPIYIWHREYESIPTSIVFSDSRELDSFVTKLAYVSGRHISIATPMVDASLPDGSRVQLTYSREVTRRGSTFTIRRFRADPLTITDLISFGTVSSLMGAYFWYLVERKASLIIGGGTASGKTTSLNALSMFIVPDFKVVSIEDTAELNLPHENWIPSVARTGFGAVGSPAEISLFDLLKAAMRQRPDYIIVGEVRGAEAYTLFQSMATGHGGLSSMHADSVTAAIHRLESEPMNIPPTLIMTLDVIAMQSRVRVAERSTRRMTHIAELVRIDPVSKEILINDVFKWEPKTDTFAYSGRSYVLEKVVERYGASMDIIKKELDRRKTVLDWMVKSNIRRYTDVSAVIRDYYADETKTYEKARLGLMP